MLSFFQSIIPRSTAHLQFSLYSRREVLTYVSLLGILSNAFVEKRVCLPGLRGIHHHVSSITSEHAHFAKMEDELQEVKRLIRKTEDDLKQAWNIRDRELILEINRRFNLLLRDKERITTGMAKMIRRISVLLPSNAY